MSEYDKKTINVGIITPPIGSAGVPPLSNLVDVISSISNSVFVITGDIEINTSKKNNSMIQVNKIQYIEKSNIICKVINHIFLQLKISNYLLKLSKKVDIWIFFLDSHALLLPFLTAKIFRKKIIILLAASIQKSSEAQNTSLTRIRLIQEKISFNFAEIIVLYSHILIPKWDMSPYVDKIIVAHRHFLDFETFTVTTPLSDRPALVGYIGRFSKEKGIQNFFLALPAILSERIDLHVLIGGDGHLKESMEVFIEAQNLSARVDFPGWISREDLPLFLNRLQILVLPSYSEGLPNIILEAMACGTPVLATPVGAIPDVIKDGETGFIMEDNSPACIARNVIRTLSSPDLEKIAENGRRFVKEQYTFEKAVAIWRKIFDKI